MIRQTLTKFILNLLGLTLIGLALWTDKYFGIITVDQGLTTILFNTHDAMDANAAFTRRLLQWCFLWPTVAAILMTSLSVMRKTGRRLLMRYADKILIMTGIIMVWHQYSISDYLRQNFHPGKDYFATHYVDPANVVITGNKSKNLVLIYVESLETTYANRNVFRNNLLQRLTDLNANHVEFERVHEMPGAQWSVAGIISTQCGVPLKLISMFGLNNINKSTKTMLPNAICLGDILAQKGYTNVYLNGSSLGFAGVGKFLQDHHYTASYGREEWLKMGVVKPAQLTSWGLPDDMLLAQAKIKLAQLIKTNKPFNLTIFTIDTHGLSGQLSSTCANQGFKNFEGIVECTSNQVAAFVEDIKKKGWLDKVTVVVMGDHLAMKNLAYNKLSSVAQEQRYIFNMFVTNQPLVKNTDDVVPFDMLPTIITSLGFHIDGGRLGLGYSAFGKDNISRPVNSIVSLRHKIGRNSSIYNQLWLGN